MSITFNFRRDLKQSVGSSGFGMLLTLVTTPIMTRLFPAEAYGINGMIMTFATLVASFGLLGLPVALAREQQGLEQARLLHASTQVAVLLLGLCIVAIAAVLLGPFALPDGMTILVVLVFPLLVVLHCAQRILDSLINAKGRFPAQAAARIGNAVTARGITLILGWLAHPVAASMLAGDGAGKIMHVAMTMRLGRLGADLKALRWRPDPKFLFRAVRDYRDFALQSNFASALPLLAVLGIQVLLGITLGTEAVGYYVLAQSIITLPVTVVALASAPVVFHRLVIAADATPEKLPRLVLQAILGYLTVGTIFMAPILLFGPAIFVFAFGDPWRSAGMAAAVLAIPQVLSFGLTGVLSMFRVTRRINAWLGFEITGTTTIISGMLLLPQQTDLMTAMIALAVLKLGYNILMLAGCLWASRQMMEREP